MATKKTNTPPIPQKRIGIRRLIDAEDVRRLLAKLIKLRLHGEIDDDMLRTVTYASTGLLKAVELGKIETELQDIQEQLDEKRNTQWR